MVYLLLLLAAAMPFVWLASEFQPRIWLRIVSGIGALIGIFCISSLVSAINGLGSNAYFSSSNQELIDSTIEGLDHGQTDVVLR